MNLKTRIERMEQRQGSKADVIQMVGGIDWFGPTDTIEQWQAACKIIDAEYARMKNEGIPLSHVLKTSPRGAESVPAYQ
jgi:hypothetical protein